MTKLLALRRERKMTQAELAERIGVLHVLSHI